MAKHAESNVERRQPYSEASVGGDFPGIGTRQLELSGRVQGVGFRPFVYRLANELGLNGEICNRLGTVQVIVQGPIAALDVFQHRLITDAPPLAQPILTSTESIYESIDKSIDKSIDQNAYKDFQIRTSRDGNDAHIFVPPDYFLCADCASEQNDPADRRYQYPFINCTQCGPRYTLIRDLPYDRANTSMAEFALCPECLAEYTDPGDRRFHAEPIACPVCGPQISFEMSGLPVRADKEWALIAALNELRAGRILGVKGIGGYHLMCDASNPGVVARLRLRKQRPDKPLAVMFPIAGNDGLDDVRRHVCPSDDEAALLISPMRPIVLVNKRADCSLANNVAPGLRELGVFLPYSPLHQLLLNRFGRPLVATSGNISGEPVLTDNEQASSRLANIADAFLHHNRPIVRPADDPVYRSACAVMRPIRLGRGVAPLELALPWRQTEPVICVGGHMKTTVTLSWHQRAVVSPHIGEMDSPRSLEVFEQVLADLQDLYGVKAKRIICDAHTGYATHQWARRQDRLPVTKTWHHHAHASALVGETGLSGPWLMFAWDGVGLGEDGTLWGGEALLGDAGDWQRVCSLRPFRPPGGERAGREPWRSAAAMLWETGCDWRGTDDDLELARSAWNRELNCPQTSAAGRLFDAAAAFIIKSAHKVSFEAQGPMLLESLCRKPGDAISLPLYEDAAGVLRSDWEPLLETLCEETFYAAEQAEIFHSSMAKVIADQAIAMRARHEVRHVGLVGGVFQNRQLTEQASALLRAAGFQVHLNRALPCNDAALSFGQAAEWAAHCQQGRG